MSALTDEQLWAVYFGAMPAVCKTGALRAVADAAVADDRVGRGEPVFWYRPTSTGGYDSPIHNYSIEDCRKECGAWKPLYATPTIPEGYALVPIDGIRYAIGILESNFGPMIRQATADGLKKLLPKMIEIAKEVQS